MDNLIGNYQHTLDTKGRMFLPSKLRTEIGDSVYMTRGLDHCIFLFSEEQWKVFYEKIQSITTYNARDLQRFFFGNAAQSPIDAQGRIAVPQGLRDFAGLQKDVTVVGVSGKLELWDTDKWNEFNLKMESDESVEAALRAIDLNI